MDNDTKRRLGAAIRRQRVTCGLSKLRFGMMVGVNRLTLRRIEAGTANPTLDVLLRIADGLDISLGELFRMGDALPESALATSQETAPPPHDHV